MRLIDVEFFAGSCKHRKGLYSKECGLLFYCDFAPNEIFQFDDEEVIFVCTHFCPKKREIVDDE
jgi:hypothetical protein